MALQLKRLDLYYKARIISSLEDWFAVQDIHLSTSKMPTTRLATITKPATSVAIRQVPSTITALIVAWTNVAVQDASESYLTCYQSLTGALESSMWMAIQRAQATCNCELHILAAITTSFKVILLKHPQRKSCTKLRASITTPKNKVWLLESIDLKREKLISNATVAKNWS